MGKEIVDPSASFYTTGDGLKGCYVEIMEGPAKGERKQITGNSPTRLTLESAFTKDPTGYPYQIGNIDFYCVTKEFSATDFGYQPGTTINFQKLIIECDEQAPVYKTGRVNLTNGSAAVVGVGTLWQSAIRGENFYVPGYNEKEYFISSAPSITALTLTSAWQGQTGQYVYCLGAKLLEISYYLNGDTPVNGDTAFKTVYGNMESSPLTVPIGCKAKSLTIKIRNNRVNEPVKIHSITIKEPTSW